LNEAVQFPFKVDIATKATRENTTYKYTLTWSQDILNDTVIGGSPPENLFNNDGSTTGPEFNIAGDFTILKETGLIFGVPQTVGSYTIWLVIEDEGGSALQRGLPKELDQAVVARWNVAVIEKNVFVVAEEDWKWNLEGVDIHGIDASMFTDPNEEPNKIYGVGATYVFAPINVTKATGHYNSAITFTMRGAPPGFLIDPQDGFIQGTPSAIANGSSTMQIYAVDGVGAESWLANVTFDVRFGPNKAHCENDGLIVPLAPSDPNYASSFACDCDSTGFEGNNCELNIAERQALEAAAVSKQKEEETAQKLVDEQSKALEAAEAATATALNLTANAEAALEQAEIALINTKKAQNETIAAEGKAAAQSSKAEADKKQTSFTTGLAAGGVIILLLIVVAAVKFQQHKIAMKPVDFQALFNQMLDSGDITSAGSASGATATADKSTPVPRLPREIPRQCVTKSEKVGEGAFGEVFKAILDESKHGSGGVPGYLVACKSVIDPTGDGAKDLLQEATIMAQVGFHNNLLSLIGVVTSGTPLLIVLALAEYGSLKSQLEKRALGEGKLAAKPGALPPKIDADIALEIAQGMQHLVEHNLVHRDLAARNVLIDSALTSKVADFGLSRAFSENSDYYKSTTGMMALRWTAPEAMETLKFSLKTDVWAFGIVMLEIATNGETPIKELTNPEIMVKIQSGYLTTEAKKPENCPSSLYKVMCKCWHLKPDKRPSFKKLIALLSSDDIEGGKTMKPKSKAVEETVFDADAGAAYVVKGNVNRASVGLYSANTTTAGGGGAAAESASALYAVDAGGAAAVNRVATNSEYVVKGDASVQAANRAGIGLYSAGGAEDANSGYVVKGDAGVQAANRAGIGLYSAGGAEDTNSGYVVKGDTGVQVANRASIGLYSTGDVGKGADSDGSNGYIAIGDANAQAVNRSNVEVYAVAADGGEEVVGGFGCGN
jgi:hypothetical protein